MRIVNQIFILRINFILGLLLLLCVHVSAQDHDLGASFRAFQFLSFEDSLPGARNDQELGIFRVTDYIELGRTIRIETHGVIDFSSPPSGSASRLAVSKSSFFLPLQFDIADHEDYFSEARLDRFNLSFDLGKAAVTIGRQPITWGEGYFWPALDLFSPFSPEQLDRDYKSGVDAVKISLPLGNLSELEIVGGIQGSSLDRDGTVGALLRWNLGNVDVGFMGGSFHSDSIGGVFLSADVMGTGLHGELSYTSSGDRSDRLLDREEFWRGSFGIIRQLTPTISITSELAFNGYGADNAEDYSLWYLSDRMGRGDVNGYGRYYWGTSITQQIHPLLIGTFTSLVNFSDNSVLLTPSATWSLSDNSEILAGGLFGMGEGMEEINELPIPGSEYGSVPATIFIALKVYF